MDAALEMTMSDVLDRVPLDQETRAVPMGKASRPASYPPH
jgi:hypothetical protein